MKIAILILAAIVEIIQIYKDFYEKKLRKIWPIIFVFFKLIAISGLAYYAVTEIEQQNKDSKIKATTGKFGKQKDSFIEFPVLVLGTNISQGNRNGPIEFTDSPQAPIYVSTENNQLQIIANIRDSKGDIVATIKDRTWEVLNPSSIEYNNDDSGFEIVSGGRVFFQIDFKVDTVLVKGILCSESGICIVNTKKGSGPVVNTLPSPQRFNIPYDYDVTPLFKYPRAKYHSKRVIPRK